MSESTDQRKPEASAGGATMNRRDFFRRTLRVSGQAGLAGGALGGLISVSRGHGDVPGLRGELGVLRPPNARDEDAFGELCIRCTRCSDACEAQCIRLFGPEAGDLQGTPYVLPTAKGCTMCLACGSACPTGAIEPLERKEDVDMGVAVIDERLCVSHNGTGICGACHTACPLRNRAIMQNYRNAPEVNPEQCTGCGLCEESCIVRDRQGVRAIQVQSKRVVGDEA